MSKPPYDDYYVRKTREAAKGREGADRMNAGLSAIEKGRKEIIKDILKERIRQDEKWGNQSWKSDGEWCKILGEEFGEICKAMLEGGKYDIYIEAIDLAAVCLALCEATETIGGLSGVEPSG